MAIKVISKPIGKAIYQGECNICHTRFEFEHGDANLISDSQREGFHYNVTCLACNKRVWVKKKILRYE